MLKPTAITIPQPDVGQQIALHAARLTRSRLEQAVPPVPIVEAIPSALDLHSVPVEYDRRMAEAKFERHRQRHCDWVPDSWGWFKLVVPDEIRRLGKVQRGELLADPYCDLEAAG